jgi:1-acyl-sn-glycerol-3-phosphate acyltransferase
LRATVRAALLVLVLLTAVVTTAVLVLPRPRLRLRWLRTAAWAVLAAAGVRVRVGDLGPLRTASGALVVANHLSWIEVLALCAVAPVRLLAKREIRDWPLIGAVAGVTGMLFIDRAGLRALPGTVADMAGALRSGQVVAAFPEGTTWCGAAAGPFRRAAFQAALDAGVPVHPVAVSLTSAGRPTPRAAYIGDQSLLHSVGQILLLPALVCRLTVLPALAAEGSRAELAARAAAAVAVATGVAHGQRPAPSPVPAC